MKSMTVCGAIVLLAALLAAPAAQAQFAYTTNNGTITIIKYTGSGGTVIIADQITGLPVTDIGEGAFSLCESLTNVTVGTNVASIGYGAFDSCTNLTNLTLPASLRNIGEYAFQACSSLCNLNIPAGVTNIGEGPICASLSIAASGVLARCSSLTSITVDPENMFYRSINGVLFDKSASTLIQYPGGISGSYTIPGSVTSIQVEAFCATALTSITIPASVTNFGAYAFAYCTNLSSVTMANGVTGLGGEASLFVFQGCSSLTSVTIPGSIGSIGGAAFISCSSLTNATIGNGVTNMGSGAFDLCLSMTSVYFQGNAPAADSSVFANDPFATAYYLPGTTGWSAFSANTGLPVVLWNPLIQTADGGFGVRANQFGFNITGTPNIPIVVQAADNLDNPVWTSLQSLTLTNGSYYFSEPFQPASAGRFYRIASQ